MCGKGQTWCNFLLLFEPLFPDFLSSFSRNYEPSSRFCKAERLPGQASSSGGAEPRWGEATSDESDSEVAQYGARRREILDSAATVFADASEEFAALPALKARLEAWKAAQPGVRALPCCLLCSLSFYMYSGHTSCSWAIGAHSCSDPACSTGGVEPSSAVRICALAGLGAEMAVLTGAVPCGREVAE